MDKQQFYDALGNVDVRNALFGMPGTMQFPVIWQLARLGLDKEKVREIKGKTALDFGCGSGGLVKFLVKNGIKAEGIDPDAPEGDNFMRQKVESIYPLEGSIPREEEVYDVVLSNSNNVFCLAFSNRIETSRRMAIVRGMRDLTYLNEFDENIRYMEVEAHLMMMEALRVLKKGGGLFVLLILTRSKKKWVLSFLKETIELKKSRMDLFSH